MADPTNTQQYYLQSHKYECLAKQSNAGIPPSSITTEYPYPAFLAAAYPEASAVAALLADIAT